MSTATAERPRVNTHSQVGNALEDAVKETESRRKTLTASAATILGVRPDQVCNLLRNVWTTSKGSDPLTDQEMFTGISMIARYELDPIAREIYVTRAKDGRLMTVIGVDGWIKILDRTDHYDGFEQECHETQTGEVDWIETRVYSNKRKHPTVYRAYMKEYRAISGFIAGKIPIHMLGIFSLRHAARRFVPLGGHVVTEEEANYMATGDIQRDAKGQSAIDELTDALLKPVLQHPSEPEPEPEAVKRETKPSFDELFATYQAELLATVEVLPAQQIRDKYFGPNSDIPWPEEYRGQGEELFAKHTQVIRDSRGQKSNKSQKALVQ